MRPNMLPEKAYSIMRKLCVNKAVSIDVSEAAEDVAFMLYEQIKNRGALSLKEVQSLTKGDAAFIIEVGFVVGQNVTYEGKQGSFHMFSGLDNNGVFYRDELSYNLDWFLYRKDPDETK